MRFSTTCLFLSVISAYTVFLSGCVSDLKMDGAIKEAIMGPIMLGAYSDIFWSQHQRWPKDYSELIAIIQQFGGETNLVHYDQVDFNYLQDGGLKILMVKDGVTNQATVGKPETK